MKQHLLFFRTLLITAVLLLFINARSQNFGNCAYIDETITPLAPTSGCENTSDAWIEKYRTPGYWIPNWDTPIKTILVNWVVCRDNNGQNGWQDTPEFHAQVALMFSHINEWYSNSQPKGYSLTCEPDYTHIYDTRIRFELNEIIFIDKTEFNTSCWATDILNYIHLEYPDSKNVLNHIFTMPTSPCINGAWGYYSSSGPENSAFVQTWYSMYSDSFVVWDDHIAHITHEYGHAVGQHHTYNGEQRCTTHYDFLDDVFGLCAEPMCAPCSSPCGDDYVCYLKADCFWQYQTQPFSLMSGYNNSRYISPKSAGRMHRALSIYENNFVVDNRPMHKYVKENHSFPVPLTINEDETWDFAIKMYQDIVVESGNTLTISCEVKMPINGKVIVKPEGRLVVDGGRITSAHSQPWQGIQVWGNKTAHQFPDASGNYQQGYLELKNGAIIENAIVAVELWNPDQWNTTGGMVYADGAIFRNNAKSVHALHYRNFNPYNTSQEMEYSSNFKNCTFEITADYPGDVTFFKHVDLAYVNGVDFQACDFSLAENVSGASTWSHGIAGYNAKFRVSAICNSPQYPCPEVDYDKCTFTGFYNGVSAVNDGNSVVTFNVNRGIFNNNVYGVMTRDMNNATVLSSDFGIGHLWECGAGIYADNVTGFAFEENDFSKHPGGPVSNYFGIIINNSEAVNEVYKNNFSELSYANFADGKNWVGEDRYQGLTYFCNENQNNYADFYVVDKLLNQSPHSGIGSFQGDDNHVAGNKFSQSGATWHFYNGGEHLVAYYYNQNNSIEIPELSKTQQVARVPKNLTNTCPSHYGGGSTLKLVLTSQQKTEAELEYYDNLSDYNSVKSLYDTYVDGGSTASEISDIQSAQPDDMWALRAQLLGDSPHLSLEVLKEVADRTDVFTETALFDILAANPDELKKDTLISYLENKEEPLPEYMIDILKQLAEGVTYKTILQQQMSYYKQNYSRAANEIIRSILNDSVTNYTELRNWLDNLGGIASDRQIISICLSEGNYTDALNLANMLPQLYNLQGDELTEHGFYMDMLNLYQTLNQQGRNTFQLTTAEKSSIELIVEKSKGIAGAQAKSIMEAVYNVYYTDCPEADGVAGYKQSSVVNPNELGKAYGLNITVKPNPASQWAAFDYTLPGDQSTGIITITDVTGHTVDVLNVSGQQGQKLWDTRNLNSGVYIFTLSTGGFSQSGKIVVSK